MADCFECGLPAKHNHHVVPQSLGGTKTVPLCDGCHPRAHGEKGYWTTSDLAKARVLRMRADRQWTGGRTPYGYEKNEDNRLVFKPDEWQVLKFVLIKRLLGETLFGITAQLNAAGVPTKNKSPFWERCTIKQIVRRRGAQKWRNKRTRAPF